MLYRHKPKSQGVRDRVRILLGLTAGRNKGAILDRSVDYLGLICQIPHATVDKSVDNYEGCNVKNSRAVSNEVLDALANAETLYSQYSRLNQLGEFAAKRDEEHPKSEIIASASPVLITSYQNALLG